MVSPIEIEMGKRERYKLFEAMGLSGTDYVIIGAVLLEF